MGHVFWDQDTWMFPPVALLHADLGRLIVGTRLRTHSAAVIFANVTGFKGARYPWESAYTGGVCDSSLLLLLGSVAQVSFYCWGLSALTVGVCYSSLLLLLGSVAQVSFYCWGLLLKLAFTVGVCCSSRLLVLGSLTQVSVYQWGLLLKGLHLLVGYVNECYSRIGIYWWGLLLKGLLLQVGCVSVCYSGVCFYWWGQESAFTCGTCYSRVLLLVGSVSQSAFTGGVC